MAMKSYFKIILAFCLITVSVGAAVGSGAASSNIVQENRPDSVSCSYDKTALEKYQPRLQISHLDVQPSTVYAQYCTSSNYDYDIAMYWVYYPVQNGYSSEDSHRLDREPVYVFINSDGSVKKIAYSGWHYMKSSTTNPDTVSTRNVTLRAVDTHHHFIEIGSDSYGEYTNLSDFSEVHQNWYQNGWEANPDVTANPYEIQNHTSWWGSEGQFSFINTTELYWEIQLKIQEYSPFKDDPTTDIEI